MFGSIPFSRSRWYSYASVFTSYSRCPVMKISLSSDRIIPGSSASPRAAMLSLGQRTMSSNDTAACLDWGILNTLSRPLIKGSLGITFLYSYIPLFFAGRICLSMP